MLGVVAMVTNYNEVLYDNETLETQRLLLRRFTKDDAADVLEYGSDEEVLRYTIWDGVRTIDEAKESIFGYLLQRAGIFAIELKATGKCIGCIDIRLDVANDKFSFGYILNHKYWGMGYMTEALSVVMELCFEELGANRAESCHYVGNEASGKVMAKCGMKLEGVAKQQHKVKGIFQDVCHYGITKADWLAGIK